MEPVSIESAQRFSPLLIVEDSNEDFEAFQRFLSRWYSSSANVQNFSLQNNPELGIPCFRCINGEQALAFLFRSGQYADPASAPRPGLILLDLNLPGTDGREVLCRIKQNEQLKTIPVIVFTTSSSPKDIEACYKKGANSYIIKPINFNQLRENINLILDFWLTANTLPTIASQGEPL